MRVLVFVDVGVWVHVRVCGVRASLAWVGIPYRVHCGVLKRSNSLLTPARCWSDVREKPRERLHHKVLEYRNELERNTGSVTPVWRGPVPRLLIGCVQGS